MITAEVQLILNIALKEATRLRHEYILCEHLLYCIALHDYGASILEKAKVDVPALRASLEKHLAEGFYCVEATDDDYKPEASVALERVINRAIKHCLKNSNRSCNLDDIVITMLEEKDSYAVYLLYKYGLSKYELLKLAAYDTSEKTDETNYSSQNFKEQQPSRSDVLAKYTLALRDLARKQQLDPLIAREQELEQMLTILSRRKKNNPLLVGSPGVGKTALVEGLALNIEKGSVHPAFRDVEIYSLDMGNLVAGTRFRGDFEERIKQLFHRLSQEKHAILFIDEIHTVVGSGTAGNSHLDAANLLKPFLTKGNLRFIGATTYQEYRSQFQKDYALARRFEKIDIAEPSAATTLHILTRLKPYYERYHNITYPQKTLKKIVTLTQSYLKEKHLPDSAIDILDIAGARVKLKHFTKIKPTVTTEHVEATVSHLANVPLKKIDTKEKANIRDLAVNLKKRIFGQDVAVAAVVKAIKLSKSLLGEGSKPIASFLFTGPTGVGKTELARVLTELIHIKLIRLDMSEYMEAHAISKLIGAPPGYVGFNDYRNHLTEQIRKHPHSLLLLDEIEKAHPDVLNTFLQIMDYGTLTDSASQKIDFTNAIIIMTSNAGADELSAPLIGFTETDSNFKAQTKINKIFTPEFRNRLSAVIHFNFLAPELLPQLIHKFISELNTALAPKKVTVTLAPAALSQLGKIGFNKHMGARALKRTIEKEIKERLIDDVLFGKLAYGGSAHFILRNNSLHPVLKPLPPTHKNASKNISKPTPDPSTRTPPQKIAKKANKL